MPCQTLQLPELFSSKESGFSQVVVFPPAQIMHIAGQVGWDASGRIVARGRKNQFRTALEHVFVAVRAAGGTPDDLQSFRLHIPGFEAGRETEIIPHKFVDVLGADNPSAHP